MDRNTETPILTFLSGKKSDLDMLIKFIFKTLVSLWFASILRAEKMEKVDQTWKKNTVQRPDADILCVTTHNVDGFLSYYGQGNFKKFASSDSDAQQALLQNILGALNKYDEGENAGYANRDILERSVINNNIFSCIDH